MSQHATRRLMLCIVVGCLVVGSVFLGHLANNIVWAQTAEVTTLSEKIQQFYIDNQPLYVGFLSPIDGANGWDLPAEIEVGGEIVGNRVISSVGQDHICVAEWGTGMLRTFCIPFSNISFVVSPF